MSRPDRPQILIATGYRENSIAPLAEIMLPTGYVEGIVRAGGVPILVPPMAEGPAWEALVSQGDGLLLVGGLDIDPAVYGRQRHPETVLAPLIRCRSDCRLMNWADGRGLPTLGICLGMQTINVCRGGTLNQHVPDGGEHLRIHLRPAGQPRNRHGVRVEAGSLLSRIVGGTAVDANTSHHQAVEMLGADLRAVAWSDDGLVEAVEDSRPGRFVLGVQWHPEELIDERPHMALFEALVAAAAARRRPT